MNTELSFVKIMWEDSNCWHGQVREGSYPIAVMTTVGFLVPEQNILGVVVAQDRVDTGDKIEFRNVICIPRSCIKSQEKLTIKNPIEEIKEEIGSYQNPTGGIALTDTKQP